jgi:hypothetical protein
MAAFCHLRSLVAQLEPSSQVSRWSRPRSSACSRSTTSSSADPPPRYPRLVAINTVLCRTRPNTSCSRAALHLPKTFKLGESARPSFWQPPPPRWLFGVVPRGLYVCRDMGRGSVTRTVIEVDTTERWMVRIQSPSMHGAKWLTREESEGGMPSQLPLSLWLPWVQARRQVIRSLKKCITNTNL